MKRILIVLVLVALASVAVVTIASAATIYVLGPSHAAQLEKASAQSGASTSTLVHMSQAAYFGHADEASHIDAPTHAQGDCPLHSSASQTDSNPAY
jgi:hypothetical protein